MCSLWLCVELTMLFFARSYVLNKVKYPYFATSLQKSTIMQKEKLNVGIIGFGLSGRYLIAPYLMVNPNFQLKTVVQHTQSTASDIYSSVKSEKNLDAMLNDISK